MIQVIESREANRWLTEVHYLHRPVIRTKLLAHGIFEGDNRVGAILWATPHFLKKKGLFGFPGTYDKWEVLILSRFYLIPESNITASQALSDSIGKSGNSRSYRKRGWRVQMDWVERHPPVYPNNPYVPRLLMSWSDMKLETVDQCQRCGARHRGQHTGTIYTATGFSLFDISQSSGRRMDWYQKQEGEKRCWVLELPPNPKAQALGQVSV